MALQQARLLQRTQTFRFAKPPSMHTELVGISSNFMALKTVLIGIDLQRPVPHDGKPAT